ncbi:hypothetical protein [Aquimarina algicola]|uniref:Uncharacterized protein n=1 Tax=Aquimarina algicola TaxID=2589995 RepID=A0A504J2N8_9FLAO|nr:hypothetical protein [Aquimarina algicola]TPN80970.1 hypothetical protein FHK87_25840 [Aquimarina algicola]
MKRFETEKMIHFLYRMSMYLPDMTKDNIVSFMHGIDLGKEGEPHWTKLLDEFIAIEYKVEERAMGWPYHVEMLSEREGIEWNEGFKKLMLEMINKSDQIPFTKKMQKWINNMEN